MSFGWPRWHTSVEEAIKIASSQNVILFAAASNSGSNQPIAFPANCPPVICVHSADGYGNPSRFTPLPLVGDPSFAVIGEAVSSSWPQTRGEGREKRKWGTSTSTPILAAIAALVLEFTHQKPSPSPLELRLRSPRGMTQILLAMSKCRSNYMVVTPWLILDSNIGRKRSEDRVLDNLMELFGSQSSA